MPWPPSGSPVTKTLSPALNPREVIEVPREIIGRNRLVLKAKNSEELLYYTTDNE